MLTEKRHNYAQWLEKAQARGGARGYSSTQESQGGGPPADSLCT